MPVGAAVPRVVSRPVVRAVPAALFSGGSTVPSWVPTADGYYPDLAFDFVSGTAFQADYWSYWPLADGQPPKTLVDFATQQAYTGDGTLAGTVTTAASLLTCTRNQVAYGRDSGGTWTSFATNTLRYDYSGGTQRLLVEEARTNAIRNNAYQTGFVAGSPGTVPTNWVWTASGLTRTSTAATTTSGVDTATFRFSGTTGAGSSFFFFDTTTNASAAATYGQTWTASAFLALSAGALTNVTGVRMNLGQYDSGGVLLGTAISGTNIVGSLTSTFTRFTDSFTLTDPSTAFVRLSLVFTHSSAVAVDFTVNLGWPQIELCPSVNSTVASAVVAAGGSGGTPGTAVYSVGGGTLASGGSAATLNVTVSGGAITAINSVASAGSYTTFPPSAAALTYVSGTGSGVTGATVTLTPTNNASLGFATSPIRTTSAAVTRPADVVSMTLPTALQSLSAYTLFGKAMPYAPTTYATTQNIVQIDAGSAANRHVIRRQATTGALLGATVTAVGNGGSAAPSGTWAQDSSKKLAYAVTTNDAAAVFDNGTPATDSTVDPPASVANLRVGANVSVEIWNGGIEQIALWGSRRTNSALGTITT